MRTRGDRLHTSGAIHALLSILIGISGLAMVLSFTFSKSLGSTSYQGLLLNGLAEKTRREI
jgi:hypothetical protein